MPTPTNLLDLSVLPDQLGQLVRQLPLHQQHAIGLLSLSLDCFNSRDGTGLFTGPGRYGVLADRVTLCGTQATTLLAFWALLLRKMQWSVPPKKADEQIILLMQAEMPAAVLRSLATEAVSLVSLARMVHDAHKAAKRAYVELDEDPETGALIL